ncbi:hypothetical protein Tco_1526591, partial [Tanacetum coccineum]
LDIDNFDIPLTPVLRPCNRHVRETITITSTQNTNGIVQVEETLVSIRNNYAGIVQVEEVEEKPVKIIPGPAGTVQLAKIRKQSDIPKGGDDSVLSTQEYMKQVFEDVGEDEDFNSGMWVGTTDGVGWSGMLMKEEEIVKLVEEEEMVDLELHVCGNVIDQEDLYKFDEEALNLILEEEARQAWAHQEWLEK